jgi:arylsulfatase A-like enzyme
MYETIRFISAILASTAALATAVGKSEKPNVLFIAVDDLNDFPFFAHRHPDAKTPHMDRLAERGTVFTSAHCQFPLCGPSRASIMSGLLPSTLGYDNHMSDEDLQARARELGTELLHVRFAQNGYKTLAVGKILHHHVPKGPDRQGPRSLGSEPVSGQHDHRAVVGPRLLPG